MRLGLFVTSCLALAVVTASAQRITDASAIPADVPAGALLVSADPASCLVPSTLTLARVEKSSYGIVSRQTGACRWVIDGLPAGSYEVGLTNTRGSGGRVRFDYVPGQPTELPIPPPAATVTGVVRINGQPVAGAKITLLGRPLQNGLPTVVTNADGSYEATIADAGLYSMRLGGDDVYGRSERATFTEGSNRYDWDIVGGTIVITDARGARARSFMVRVGDANGGFQGWSLGTHGPTRVLRGTPFGTYTIGLERGGPTVEPIATLTVTADGPRAEAVIDVP
jgi:hypothetical protein